MLPHKDEIDPKYSFLFSAPTEDNEGNKTLVRYSRKTKEQYVQSELDKKATGWKAFYNDTDGKWEITRPEKKVAKKKSAKKKASSTRKMLGWRLPRGPMR